MHLSEDFPSLLLENFQNHLVLDFDSNSLLDAAEQFHRPELSGGRFFQFPLQQVTEVIILGERLSNNQIDKFGTAAEQSLIYTLFKVCFRIFSVVLLILPVFILIQI